ncbi:hypothetical protein SCUCBS95973_003191 [Sporothrix curviconia]|uniref:Phospholipase/carboxylesterase/thioesterase domain-containing protein n=1 Tax=Sporothrix curviconia TaxID=1260050 RepID=A0ABP0BDH6_9PEZI
MATPAAPWNPLIYEDDYLRVRAVPTCHTSTFVWCHAKGQQGGDWQFMVDPLRKLGHCNHIAFIFPYLDYSEDENNDKNAVLVRKIVDAEIIKGCHPDRIAVGGYKEGFDVALQAVLGDGKNTINGVLGVTDEVNIATVKSLSNAPNAKTPVYVVDRSGSAAAKSAMESGGLVVHAYAAGSKTATSSAQPVTQAELESLDRFIHESLPVEFAEKKN